ncbi:hypothetical protein HDU91_007320 [Kappamyces sp. JEL0680]|nr:hypothetical protein HDU91_007320 [Kappamyces sp. JEL0680]
MARKILRQGVQQPSGETESLLSGAIDSESLPGNDTDTQSSSVAEEASLIAQSTRQKWMDKRLHLVYMVDSSGYTKYWDLLDLLLNFVFSLSYIGLTFWSIGPRGTPTTPAPPPPPQIWQTVDFVLGCALFLQWMPRLLLTLQPDQEIRTLFSISSILSTGSVVWVFFNFTKMEGTFLEGGNVVYLYPFRFWRLNFAISRCFPVGKKGFFSVSPVKQKAVNLGLDIFTTLFLVSAWTHICLYKIQKYYDINFLDIFYTIVVSSTSGLSTQIVPDNVFSR